MHRLGPNPCTTLLPPPGVAILKHRSGPNPLGCNPSRVAHMVPEALRHPVGPSHHGLDDAALPNCLAVSPYPACCLCGDPTSPSAWSALLLASLPLSPPPGSLSSFVLQEPPVTPNRAGCFLDTQPERPKPVSLLALTTQYHDFQFLCLSLLQDCLLSESRNHVLFPPLSLRNCTAQHTVGVSRMLGRWMDESPPALKSRLLWFPFLLVLIREVTKLRPVGNGVFVDTCLPSIYLLSWVGGRQGLGAHDHQGRLCEEVAFLLQLE